MILDVCCKGEKVEVCVTFLNVWLNSTVVLQFTYKKTFMLIYIKTVSKSVKKWLRIIRLGNLLPHPLAFLSYHTSPFMWVIGDDIDTFVLISTIGDMCVDVFNLTRQIPRYKRYIVCMSKHVWFNCAVGFNFSLSVRRQYEHGIVWYICNGLNSLRLPQKGWRFYYRY